MLTLFAMPKPFVGHIDVIQRNAIRSWTLLKPRPEIILYGNEVGTGEVARELRVEHSPEVRVNASGTPLLSDFFLRASVQAKEPLLCYINADIILLGNFSAAVKEIRKWRKKFLASGQRWDLDVPELLDFNAAEWESKLLERARREGFQRRPNWVDYFIFDREYAKNLPPFAIGRTCWDNSLIWRALDSGRPLLDLSQRVEVVHQNHDYSHHKGGTAGVWEGEEARENLRLAGGRRRLSTMLEATHFLGTDGPEKKKGQRAERVGRYARGLMVDLPMAALEWSRPIRHALGIRKKERPSDMFKRDR
jgi:hypothetical protein